MHLNLLSSVLPPWRGCRTETLLFLMTSWLVKIYKFFISTPQKKAQSNTFVFWGVVIQPLLCLEFRFYSFFLSKRNPKFLHLAMKSLACSVVSECFQWPQSEGSHALRHLGWIVEHKLCVNKWYSANHWVINCNETTMNWHYCTWCHCRGKTFIQGSVTPALQNRFLTSGTISA